MDELLKMSDYPDLVEDHGHEYGAGLGDDDKAALARVPEAEPGSRAVRRN